MPASVVKTNASTVALIPFARIGFVLLATVPSEIFLPSGTDPVKVIEDDLTHFTA